MAAPTAPLYPILENPSETVPSAWIRSQTCTHPCLLSPRAPAPLPIALSPESMQLLLPPLPQHSLPPQLPAAPANLSYVLEMLQSLLGSQTGALMRARPTPSARPRRHRHSAAIVTRTLATTVSSSLLSVAAESRQQERPPGRLGALERGNRNCQKMESPRGSGARPSQSL